MSVTESHIEKENLQVAVIIPAHDPRVTTPLFRKTREQLIERDKVCFISGQTEEEAGSLEAHHSPVERSFANMIDWKLVERDALAGELGFNQAQRDAARLFDWNGFFDGATVETLPGKKRTTLIPKDPYLFVDNMMVNGVLLAKSFHIGKDEGIHALPFPIFVAQRYGKEGYQFSSVEIIHHEQ